MRIILSASWAIGLPVFLRSTGTLWSTQVGVPVGTGTSFHLDFIGVQRMEPEYNLKLKENTKGTPRWNTLYSSDVDSC